MYLAWTRLLRVFGHPILDIVNLGHVSEASRMPYIIEYRIG